MENLVTNSGRIKELKAKKRTLLSSLRKSRKAQIKIRLMKRKIDAEILALRGGKNLFEGMTPAEATEFVKKNIGSVSPDAAYPEGLEREFDKVAKTDTGNTNLRTVDLRPMDQDPTRVKAPVEPSDDDGDIAVVEVAANSGEPVESDEVPEIAGDPGPDEVDGVIDLSEI